MHERQRLLALLEAYDTAIEELYVLEDRGFMDLILRLERRRQDAARRLGDFGGEVLRRAMVKETQVPASPTHL